MSDIEKLPKTKKIKIFITLNVSGWNPGKLRFYDFDASKYDEDQILLGTQSVTFKIPQNTDIKGELIKGLEAEKEKIQAETHMKLKGIQDKIDNLLAIEYKPEEQQ